MTAATKHAKKSMLMTWLNDSMTEFGLKAVTPEKEPVEVGAQVVIFFPRPLSRVSRSRLGFRMASQGEAFGMW